MGTKTYLRWHTSIDVKSTPVRVDEVTLHLSPEQALAVCNYLLSRKADDGIGGFILTDEVALALWAALNDHGIATIT